MLCSGSPKRFSQVFGSIQTEMISQWYQPSSMMTCRALFFFFRMAASCLLPRLCSCCAAHTPQSYTGYSLFQCPCACPLGIVDRWTRPAVSDLLLTSHEDREGWQRQGNLGSASAYPNTFPSSPCEKSTCWHYIAFHYLNMKESPLVGARWCRMKHRHKSRLVLT